MPKGQYDRKAAAAKRAAKSTLGKTGVSKVVAAEAPRVKRKYTKRAKSENVGDSALLGQLAHGMAGPGLGHSDMGQLHGLTNLLGSLSQIAQQASANGAGIPGISGLIKKAARTLENQFDALFPAEESLASVGNGHVERPVTALPVPEKFVIPPPPPAPSNPS